MADIAGLKLIVPSSVANSGGSASVSATGKVTFSAVNNVSVNGVFDSTYDNYLFLARYTQATVQDMRFRLRLSGADADGPNYTDQRLIANGGGVSGQRVSNTTLPYLGYSSNQGNGLHVYLYGPALAQPTAIRSVSALDHSGAYIEDNAITHSLSTAYDGFTFFGGGYTISGSLTIYGLSQ